jgi:type II secretory pathway pseudopilin PulG
MSAVRSRARWRFASRLPAREDFRSSPWHAEAVSRRRLRRRRITFSPFPLTSDLRPPTSEKRQPFRPITDTRITDNPVRERSVSSSQQRKRSAFTLLELLIVLGIIIILTVLTVPAFTTRKSADDLTSAADTIKGAFEQARTHAMANNTYTWVGFAGSVGSNSTAVTGQVQMAIVASTDGTNLWSANGSLPAGSLKQIGKLITLNNVHIGDTGVPSNDGTEFESRPAIDADHRISSSADTPYPFTVQQVTFNKWIQFSPRGEALLHGGTFSVVSYSEVGLLPTHGATLAVTQSGNVYLGNLAAIQVSGYGGSVRIYRR